MPLYLVVNDDANGENADQFVVANTPREAVDMLIAKNDHDEGDFDKPFRVFWVPQPSMKGVVDWPTPTIVTI